MAQVTVLKAAEGPSRIIVRVYLQSDGTGELVNYPLLTAGDLNPARQGIKPLFNIRQAWYSMVWFDFSLFAGTLQPAPLWTFARDCDSHIDFRSFGGLLDSNVYTQPPSVDDGVLLISTNNFAPVNSMGSLVLEIQKTNYASA